MLIRNHRSNTVGMNRKQILEKKKKERPVAVLMTINLTSLHSNWCVSVCVCVDTQILLSIISCLGSIYQE